MKKLSAKFIADYQKSTNDPVYFFERFLNMSPSIWQKVVVEMFYDNSCHTSYAAGGSGKTTLGLGLAAWTAITKFDQTCVIFCKNSADRKRRADDLWNMIENIAGELNIGMERINQKCIHLSNGVIIHFWLRKNVYALGGLGINYLFADDLSEWRKKDQELLVFKFLPCISLRSKFLCLTTRPKKGMEKEPLWQTLFKL